MSLLRLPKIGSNNMPSGLYNSKHLNDLIEDRSEQAAIVNAINSGYLIYPSAEFIYSRFQKQTNFLDKLERSRKPELKLTKKKSRAEFVHEEEELLNLTIIEYLNLNSVPIIETGDTVLCTNLRILVLSGNHLKFIDALRNCPHLLRIDLQNNQVNISS